MSSRRRWLAAGFAAFALLFWRRASLGGLIPFDVDTLCFYFPNWAIGRRLLNEGALLWDPYRGFGQPFLAVPQAQALYPLRFLSGFFDFVSYTRFSIFFHAAVASAFAFLWAKRRGASDAAAVVGAAAFGFSGAIVMRVVFAADFATIAWLPAALWCLAARRPAALAVVLAVQWFAGYPPLFLVSSIFLAASTLVDDEPSVAWRVLLWGAGAGAGLAAVQAVPFLEMLRGSERDVMLNNALALVNSTHPVDLARGLLLPSVAHEWHARPWYFRPMFYIGPFLLALAVAGAAAHRRRGWLFLGAGALFFALALGHYNGVTAGLSVLRVFRYPGNWVLAGGAVLAVLAVRGLDQFPDNRIKWGLALIVAVDLFAFGWPARHAWGDRTFVTVVNERLGGFETRPRGRLLHTSEIMDGYPEWDWRRPAAWPQLKTILLPSYGTAFGLREAMSHHNLTSRPANALLRRLNAPGAPAALFEDADIERVITLTAEGRKKKTPAVADFAVIAIPKAKGRAFMVGGSSAPVSVAVDAPGNFAARAQGPGLLVFSEGRAPGWRATLDGLPAPIEPYDEALQAVRLEAGEHAVAFSYRPASFRAGLLISIGTLLFLAFWTLRSRRYA